MTKNQNFDKIKGYKSRRDDGVPSLNMIIYN